MEVKSQNNLNCEETKGAVDPYLDTFLIIDPADHPHTHLSNLTEGWLLQTDVSEDLDHPLSYADTSVLCTKNNSIHNLQRSASITSKRSLLFSFTKEKSTCNSIFLPTGGSMRL